jgi:hypothetical protein
MVVLWSIGIMLSGAETPAQNAFIESFNGCLREELLNRNYILSLCTTPALC